MSIYYKYGTFEIILFSSFFLISGPFLSDLLVSLSSLFFLYYFLKYDKKFILNKFSYFFILFYFFYCLYHYIL